MTKNWQKKYVYKYKRPKKIILEELPASSLSIVKKNNIIKEKELKTCQRIDYMGILTYDQYDSLYWEKAYLTKKIKYYIYKWKNWYVRNNYEDTIKDRLILSRKKISELKILHDIKNVDNIIYMKNKYKEIFKNNLFMWDNIFQYEIIDERIYKYTKKSLRPDGVLISDDGRTIYFIETDMGKEEYKTLKNKDLHYKILIKDLIKSDIFDNYKICFFSSELRINNIVEKNIFEFLNLSNLIEYVIQK